MIRRLAALGAAGLLLASCGSVSAPSALRSWLTQSNFSSSLTTLRTDASHSAASLRDASSSPNTLHTVCGVLLVDTESANASLPTPDDQTTALLSKAYTLLGTGANRCYRAGTSSAARALAVSALVEAGGYLAEATARIAVASSGA